MSISLHPFSHINPMIYAYTTPQVKDHEDWIKIGYTEKQSVDERIQQQCHTVNIQCQEEWRRNALYTDSKGGFFKDVDFHNWLTKEKGIRRRAGTEWFELDVAVSQKFLDEFARRKPVKNDQGKVYTLRKEQDEAVRQTIAYFASGGDKFLWNAKPRFGKVLTSYELIRRMGFKKVLIVTNRPAIANSWLDDFNTFIRWHNNLCFVSDTPEMQGKKGVMSREAYVRTDMQCGMIAFESLQGLKGSVYFGGEYSKLAWMAKEYIDGRGNKQQGIKFDLLIIDEAHEGTDTERTERAFDNIARNYTLYLSGTPFKALASGEFSEEQIFNWSYADEQASKDAWHGDVFNPYECLPRLSMYTYQISPMIREHLQKGMQLPGANETVDYAFDLNEFFSTTENGTLRYETEVRKFLHSLTTHEKYPFSTPELRKELAHTLWLLNRVDSCKALAKLLKDAEFQDVFGEYEIVLAAGDGRLEDGTHVGTALARVKDAVKKHEKTITLSVEQLTVGVTVPEWCGVFMLCNLQSPSAYMQAAFRAQNPCMFTDAEGHCFRKENAYVFDFDPARTLIIFDAFANNLMAKSVSSCTNEDRRKNIQRLLNFFPVMGEDTHGKMICLDAAAAAAAAILALPRKIKCHEVVLRGFMCNFLFQNIGTVFCAPVAVQNILQKLEPAKIVKGKGVAIGMDQMAEVSVNEQGEVEIAQNLVVQRQRELFGKKIYENVAQNIETSLAEIQKAPHNADKQIEKMAEAVTKVLVTPVFEAYTDIKSSAKKRLEVQVQRGIETSLQGIEKDYKQKAAIARAEYETRKAEIDPENKQELLENNNVYKNTLQQAEQELIAAFRASTQELIEEKEQEIVVHVEKICSEEKKRSIEETIRAHLRGFSRTIPSFIMAYGDEQLTLANMDSYIEDENNVFYDVTGITKEEFRFLRDGGDFKNAETGKIEHFNGHIFDEIVFNDAIKEFWQKKQKLADYFNQSHDEDIFDYIPPQKNNQIFTPRFVVQKMLDYLEENTPGCFDNPDNTFADLHMKSGQYIAEIVKRLFRSDAMKKHFPDDGTRIRHILCKQVYGMAPTRIIYRIATNYILGFDENLKISTKNFVQADAAEAAKNNTLESLVAQHFG